MYIYIYIYIYIIFFLIYILLLFKVNRVQGCTYIYIEKKDHTVQQPKIDQKKITKYNNLKLKWYYNYSSV